MNRDITVTIENPTIFMQVTYECEIRRHHEEDGSGRTWWEPDVDATPIRVDLVFLQKDDEISYEWFYGENKPTPIQSALERYRDALSDKLTSRIKEIVNDINFTDNPSEGEPRDD